MRIAGYTQPVLGLLILLENLLLVANGARDLAKELAGVDEGAPEGRRSLLDHSQNRSGLTHPFNRHSTNPRMKLADKKV